jgi:hypothetical protein
VETPVESRVCQKCGVTQRRDCSQGTACIAMAIMVVWNWDEISGTSRTIHGIYSSTVPPRRKATVQRWLLFYVYQLLSEHG